MGELSHWATPYPAHTSRLWWPNHVWKIRLMLPEPHIHNLRLINPGVIVLGIYRHSEKKKDGWRSWSTRRQFSGSPLTSFFGTMMLPTSDHSNPILPVNVCIIFQPVKVKCWSFFMLNAPSLSTIIKISWNDSRFDLNSHITDFLNIIHQKNYSGKKPWSSMLLQGFPLNRLPYTFSLR